MTQENSGDLVMTHVYKIEAGNFTIAGEAASNIKKLLRQLGIDANIIRRASIAAYEAEMNMVIHSFGGKIRLEILSDGVIIIAQDSGPGISDIEKALIDGYSTASDEVLSKGFGAGRGFSNIKLNSDKFYIYSEVGKGTKLELHFKFPNK